MRRRTMPLGVQLLLLQVGIVLTTVVVAGAVAVQHQYEQIRDAYRQQVLTVASSTARLPSVVDAYDRPDPSTTLQPLAELIRAASGVTFVVITDAEGIRYSHPDPDRIGDRVSTDPSPTLAGEVFVGSEEGTLGRSLRAKVPVRDSSGQVVGAASVGILESQLAAEFRREAPALVAWLAGAALLGSLGSVLVVRLVRRRIFGLEPEEIARLLETREAMVHGIREGLVAVDQRGRVVLVNDEASRLLDLSDDVVGRAAAEVLDAAMLPLVAGDRPVTDELVLSGERLLVANRTPAVVGGRRVAEVLTLRDRTELASALRELDGQRNLTNTLRAQAHEFSNKLHVIQGLIELGRAQDAVAFIDRAGGGQLLDSRSLGAVADPAVTALLLAKAAVAHERGIALALVPGSSLAAGSGDDVVTVLGNLLDNAMDATGTGGTVTVFLGPGPDGGLVVRVDDDGPGVAEEDRARVFDVGVTTKRATDADHGRGIGLALVARIAARRGGSATVTSAPLGGARVDVRLGAPAPAMAEVAAP
ncbi:ATP-binding protein [Modestobacter sp. VKM Ac-2984]|uniref:ATP-binding protein n=1 Tax=Modestobacter sp. VKM Ac-2984 TaxID=3004138 RepID=UPI0022AB35CE|nr:sensor histidine kinase [Modestobacter sp. VKM Ac-2984]MCZ2818403.1 sensor histidine kinase [Modestobacter sp. VKM Ac-2984]